ncbi:hypothetical protein JO379_000866 [Streptomyces syringium]|uniref:Uncharacterized protein n=1 Tax=Streptomyces syringium TaxID=76729 RepID=A0ABS4XYU6_9ACTN|nr:hypothetical protein [Streptomyces syringium]
MIDGPVHPLRSLAVPAAPPGSLSHPARQRPGRQGPGLLRDRLNPKGFVRRHRNLTQVGVPDSGRQVPAFPPRICREMLYNWLFDRPFPGCDPQQSPKQPHGDTGPRRG